MKFFKSKKTIRPEASEQEITNNPELNVEIMVLDRKTNIIEITRKFAKGKKFKHGDFEYKLTPTGLNLIPHKDGFVAHYLFVKNREDPYNFTNMNKLIPARVLTILYNMDAYRILIQPEHKNLNLILVIIGVITLVVLAIYAWLNYGNGYVPSFGPLVGH